METQDTQWHALTRDGRWQRNAETGEVRRVERDTPPPIAVYRPKRKSSPRPNRIFKRQAATCAQCGESFMALCADVRRGFGRFCSIACSGRNRSEAGGLFGEFRTPDSTKKQRVAACGKLNYAIVKGEIVRPSACERCGKACKPHGHHEDYSKPLDVMWLCKSCHMVRHQEIALQNQN